MSTRVRILKANSPITSGTNTKISYDINGLVTSGGALTSADIPSIPSSKISDISTFVTSAQASATYATLTIVTTLSSDVQNKLYTSAAFTKTSADTLYETLTDASNKLYTSAAFTKTSADTLYLPIIPKQYPTVMQSFGTTSGSVGIVLSAGQTVNMTTALIGATTFNVSAPATGSTASIVFIQGATAQTVTVSATGVTFKQTGTTTSTANSLTVANITTVNASYKLSLFWPLLTLCYVSIN